MSAPFRSIVGLFHYRWTVPAVTELHCAGGGAKFITLVNRLAVARPTLSRTLESLVEAGWVAPNPGYGHPLRPEYILTPAGARIAPWCGRLLALLRRLRVEETGLRKWPLAVTAAVADGAQRFGEIRQAIPDVTARALTISLKDLQQASLIVRTVYDDYPPVVEYRLKERALPLVRMTLQLGGVASRAHSAS